jgi:hypothetical protein
MSLDIYYFTRHVDAAERKLSDMKFELEQYAQRENASESYIEKSNDTIALFHRFTQAARALMDAYENDLRAAHRSGQEIGYNQCKKHIAAERERTPLLLWQIADGREQEAKFYDKEEARLFSLERARRAQPELFHIDTQQQLFK